MAEIPISEEHIEYAMETAGVSWWEWDIAEGTIDIIGQGDCLLGQGCLRDKRGREDWLAEVHPEDREKVERGLEACLSGQIPEWKCEHRFRTTGGGWLWVLNQGYIRDSDEDGKPLLMRGITQDIDRLKKALTEAKNHKTLLETSDLILKVGSWDYDPATDSILWSDGIQQILEVDEDYVPSEENTYKMVLGPDREQLKHAFQQIKTDGTGYDLQLHFRTGKGRDIFCRTIGRARFNSKGEIVRIVGVFQDVTGVVKLRHEMSAFFSHTPDFHATLSHAAEFKSYNASWTETLGYSSDALRGSCLYDLVASQDREEFKATFEKVIGGESMTGYESRVLQKEGRDASCADEEVWMSWSLSCDPELELVFVTGRCVTKQKKSESDLVLARLKAEEASRAKTDFLAVMSHELRTPLNPILGFADMLLDETEDEQQKEILQSIVESSTNMLSLINELLDYSKLDLGKEKVEPEEFSLADFIQQNMRNMSGLLKGKAIEMSSSIDWGPLEEERLPLLAADVGLLMQVTRNLLSNAIKFTPEGKVGFAARVLQAGANTCVVQFSVRDTGIGICPEDQKKLFEPFWQVDSGMTRSYEGTGLGLAICRSLLNLMDGKIDLESKLGEGSCFTFEVPMAYRYNRDTDQAGPDAAGGELAEEVEPAPRAEVLVVEDNESNAFYMQSLIGMLGSNVEVVANGESALKALDEGSYDLVLLDLHMPGIGGIETLKRIRTKEKESGVEALSVYIITADASEEAKQQSLAFGADGLMTKPVSPSTIREILVKCSGED